MAEKGATIQSVGPQNIAQLTLGLKGGAVPQNILVPDLLGTIELGRRSELELYWEQDILPFGISVDVAAVAAQNSFISFQPQFVGNNELFITVINQVQVLAVVAAKLVAYYVGGSLGGTFANWFSQDNRFGFRPQSGSGSRLPEVGWGTAALAGATTPALWRSAISSVGALPFPGVAFRGQGPAGERLILALDTVNLPLSINVSGYSVPVRAT